MKKTLLEISLFLLNLALLGLFTGCAEHEHSDEAMRVGDDMLQLTDSLQRQEQLTNVEQMQQILRQEEEIAQKRQSISTQRIILITVFL